jgi:hypothetical protein
MPVFRGAHENKVVRQPLIENEDQNFLYIQRNNIALLSSIPRSIWEGFAGAVLRTQQLLKERHSSFEEVRTELNEMLGTKFEFNKHVVKLPKTPDDFILEFDAYNKDQTSPTRRAMYGKLIAENLPPEVKELFSTRERGGYGDMRGDYGPLVQITVGNARNLTAFLKETIDQEIPEKTQYTFQNPGKLYEKSVLPLVLANIETLIEKTKERKLIETADVFLATMNAMQPKTQNALRPEYSDESAQEAQKKQQIAALNKQIDSAWLNLVTTLEVKNVGNLWVDARTGKLIDDDQLRSFVAATQDVKLTDVTNERLTLAQYVERTALERTGEEMARFFQRGQSGPDSTAAGTTGLERLRGLLTGPSRDSTEKS